MRKTLMLGLVVGGLLSADDQLVTVDKKYVSAEGLKSQEREKTAIQKIGEYAGVGKEIGDGIREGLNAVSDVSDKFSKTDVGRFVMLLIAWKVLGKQLIGVVFGIPIFVLGMLLWWIVVKRSFFPFRVLVAEDAVAKTKTYEVHTTEFSSRDARTGLAWACGAFALAWCVMWVSILF